MCLKKKCWSKMGVPANWTRCPDHLSRQFLTTASTFPYSSKYSSAEHIRAFYTCLCVRASAHACVCVCEWVRVCVCVCLSMWMSVFIRVRHVGKMWICSAEELLELCGKVEAVIRNCLLRWSEHLVEVAGIPPPPFDQYFCLKHFIFCSPIRAFFPLV